MKQGSIGGTRQRHEFGLAAPCRLYADDVPANTNPAMSSAIEHHSGVSHLARLLTSAAFFSRALISVYEAVINASKAYPHPARRPAAASHAACVVAAP